MNRKETIKKLREIVRNLKDSDLFEDGDFFDLQLSDGNYIRSRVKCYISNKLDL